ncbi:MAG: helix-turn-helix domain-containing protein, partial [Bacteroidota bacterium]
MHAALVSEVDYYLKDRGLTRSQFAEQLGVSKGYVSQLLNGVQDFKMSSLINLALAIEKDPVLVLADKQRRGYTLEDTVSVVADEGKKYGGDRIHQKVNWSALNALPILETTRQMKEEVDSLRPFSRNMENHVLQQYLRIWNYNSNAIEGNKLDYGETIALLLYGLTAKGKPLKDHLEVIGHQEAVELMLEMVKGDRGLTQHDIRQLHQVMLKEDYQQRAVRPNGQEVFRTIHVGRYKLEPNHVVTTDGTVHLYAEPSAVPG